MEKKFNIEVISKKPKIINKQLVYLGRITIEDLKETFYMPLNSWTIEEYKQQWKEGLERIKTHDSSCLIVTMSGLNKSPWIELWILYKENNTIFIQNQYLFGEVFQERAIGLPPYDAKTCYLYVPPRETISEDNGRKISEWKIDISDIPEL
jgi:hypothetical protein